MSAIHYKFSSSNDYKNVTFDGLSISVHDCKKAIMQKEKLKMTEVDLLVTNAQSLKDYREETDLIPKNTALLVRRIPLGAAPADKSRVYIVKKNETAANKKSGSSYMTFDELKKTEDLAAAHASELDKIKAMMDQSTTEYDPSKYLKPPKHGSYQRYDPSAHSPFVKCFKCNQTGHYSSQCRLSKPVAERPKAIRQATGIPRSHMVQVNKDARGAMLTADGQYVVPFIDKKGYEIGKKEKPPFLPDAKEEKEDDEDEPVPDELICLLCKEIMEDAVVIPCCGNSYCDECIRNALLESEEHECPTCHKKNISPDSLIANKFLRQAVNKFRNETGISRKKTNVWPRPAPVEMKPTPPAQPTKVTYGPPKSNSSSQAPATSGAYVVKARSAQVYAAQGYTVKKATSATVQSSNATTTTSTISAVTPATTESVTSQPGEVVAAPAGTPSDASINNSSSTLDSGESAAASLLGITPLPVKTEPKISPLNMMVERPKEESPPPPPPLPPPHEKPLAADQSLATSTEENQSVDETASPAVSSPEEKAPDEPAAPQTVTPPSLLDDIPPVEVSHFPIQSQGINITLKNAPPVQVKPDPKQIVDPPLSQPLQIPPQRPSLLGPVPSIPPVIQQPTLNVALPRMAVPPPGLARISAPPITVPPLTGAMLRLPPPPLMRASGPPLNIPTSIPPPGLVGLHGQRITVPPPIRGLPPGVIPPLPFPPPLGVPPPAFLKQPPPTQIQPLEGQGAPPPPGTATPPSIPVSAPENRRSKRGGERSSSRSKREGHMKENKVPSKSRTSKLAMMSDEFTREQKERVASRKRKPRRGRTQSQSESDSYSSSSYSSSSSRSSSRSSYSSSESSSYSSSGSYTDSRSRSRTPTRRRKKREATKRGKKTESRSYTRSRSHSLRRRSASPSHKKRGKKPITKHRKDSRSPVKRSQGSRRRRSRSGEQDSPRRSSRYRREHEHRRRSRTRSRERCRSDKRTRDEPLIPGMPPQSVLDYERDLALYEYYKTKYEKDWIQSRILPPSPFKRFINYDPTKIPPPIVQPHPQPVLRELAPHVPVQGPHVGIFPQPPPPGDATPTEEDAGMYAYRDRTPERFVVRQGPAPWDPPAFDGDLAERARLLQEEEYYASMQNKLRRDVERSQGQRGFAEPPLHFDPRNRQEERPPGGRYGDERRRRGRSPMDRGGRGWERDSERYSSRSRRRENEDSSRGTHRDSRDRDRDRDTGRRRKGEIQKDSRSSRRDEDSRSTRKRGRDYGKRDGESSRTDAQSKKRSRGTGKTHTPDSFPASEPVPPGEGDGTPVRDESRVEFSNESIKVKVINDKVKPKTEKPRDRETNRLQDESKAPGSRLEEKSSSHPKQSRVRSQKKEERAPRPEEPDVVDDKPPEDGADEPALERSPTPTLDENTSPFQAERSKETHAGDGHTRMPVSAERDEPLKKQIEEYKKLGNAGKESSMPVDHKRTNKSPKSTRVATKTKQTHRVTSQSLEGDSNKIKERTASRKEEAIKSAVPKSKWESDEETGSKKVETPKEVKDSPGSQSHEFKPIKPRKIRIKKPGSRFSTDSKNEKEIKEVTDDRQTQEEKIKVKHNSDNAEQKQNVPLVSDSRRVVVSSANQTSEKQFASKLKRSLRPSISTIDEATFEPDYNDNESEKALSNYAPSDFEESEQEQKNGGKIMKEEKGGLVQGENGNEKNSKNARPPGKKTSKGDENDPKDSAAEKSDEGYDRSKKKKKKKKKKHKKHHHQDENEEKRVKDDFSNEDVVHSETDEDRRPSKSSGRRGSTSAKHTKYESDEHTSNRHPRSKKERRHSEKGRKGRRYDDEKSGNRKRKLDGDLDDEYSDEEERRPRKRSQRSPAGAKRKERRRGSERDDLFFEDEDYSDEGHRSPTPEDRRRHKYKKQKHKKSRKEPAEKEVKMVASRIRR